MIAIARDPCTVRLRAYSTRPCCCRLLEMSNMRHLARTQILGMEVMAPSINKRPHAVSADGEGGRRAVDKLFL